MSTNDNKNNINNKKGMHINELYQQQGASRATTGTTKRASTGNVIMNNNNLIFLRNIAYYPI